MRYYNKNQTNQDRVLDNNCYITFVLIVFTLKIILL